MKNSNKPSTDTLVLEVTRKCNMNCPHCLRGNAEAASMDFEIAIEAINKFSSIGSLAFSGGEPTLRADFIEAVVSYIIENKIDVQGFYVASNGKMLSMETMWALTRLYGHIAALGYDTDLCQFEVSLDQYHETIAATNMHVLRAFSFVTHRKPIAPGGVLNEGRAMDNGIGRRKLNYRETFAADDALYAPSYEMVYVNAKGNIYPNCDFSFATQDNLLPRVHIKEAKKMSTLARKYNERINKALIE